MSSIYCVFRRSLWVGVFERTDLEGYAVARVVFVPKPTDAEIFDYLYHHFPNKIHFSRPDIDEERPLHPSDKMNPKRRQREAAALLAQHGTSTKAQEAVKRSYEEHKQMMQKDRRIKRDLEEHAKYQKKIEKKKQKKRGR